MTTIKYKLNKEYIRYDLIKAGLTLNDFWIETVKRSNEYKVTIYGLKSDAFRYMRRENNITMLKDYGVYPSDSAVYSVTPKTYTIN